jgi:hypothetical protein
MASSDDLNGSDSEPPASSWPAERGSDPGVLMSHWPLPKTEAVVSEAARGVNLVAEEDDPPWERWYDRALEAGVADELAVLGRSLMREAWQRGYRGEQAAECGWLDDGEAMLELARSRPRQAASAWRRILDRG